MKVLNNDIFIPKIFNIHINDIANKIVPFFPTFFMCLSTLFCLKNYYLFDKTDKNILSQKSFFILYPVLFVLLSIYPMFTKYDMDVFSFSSIHSTHRYF